MESVGQDRAETARKSETLVLQAFSDPGANDRAAEYSGLSAGTVSKFKNPENALNIESVCKILASLGLKIVLATDETIDPDEKRYLLKVAHTHIGHQLGNGKAVKS